MDMAFPTIGGDVHTASSSVVDDGPPMDMPICCCHIVPPNDEDFSLSGSITEPEQQKRCVVQMVTLIQPGINQKKSAARLKRWTALAS